MMSFDAVHTLTGCLLHVEASADLLGWGRPPLVLLVQDRPAPTAPHGTRRQMRAVHLPLNDTRIGRYRAGLADLLADLATALDINQPVARPTLAACVDVGLIMDLLADPTPDAGCWPGPCATRTSSSSPTTCTRSAALTRSTPTAAATGSRGCDVNRTPWSASTTTSTTTTRRPLAPH
ncbi:hypothetical protein ABZ749_22210 [Micromonospora sp. NPDC047753]|uniref:hypothetical protein n=1 Tax=Micromonospora sp. NPDC047753 TaxID=3154817 RepID=UPI0033F37014